MEKKVYVRYECRFPCSRAMKSFETLEIARKYMRSKPSCIGCVRELHCAEYRNLLVKVTRIEQIMSY